MGHDTDKSHSDHLSYRLAQWVEGLRYEDLPTEVVDALRRFILDSLGCAFGGWRSHDWGIVRSLIEDEGGKEVCNLLGQGGKVSPLQAAFLNALAIRAQDYNDIYWKQDPSHPSDILSGPMAAAELAGLGAKDMILGMIVAYEIEQRLCEVSFPGIRELGWHHATLTAFAGAYAAGKTLGLNAEQLQHAAGIAGSANCTLGAVTAGHLTMMKNTVDPMATRAGLEAALLAQKGYQGPAHVFEGKESLAHVMDSEWKWEIFDDLGKDWRILECGMKFFPTEALTHAPISCTISICQDNGLAADDIAKIRIRTLTKAADILSDPSKYNPTTRETADHSLPYCITAGVLHGRVTPDLFDDEVINDPRVQQHIHKIEVVAEPEFEAAFPKVQRCHVAITTTDGRTLEKQVDYPKGDPRDPLTDQEIRAKFDALAEGVSEGRRQEIWDAAARLAEFDRAADFLAICAVDQA
ncbi:MAG: MmgE/PrpD family protein [Planctomycetota bacterium]|nr:MAG: MmgE/PrpD family protein [Planctomycetota bacterium]